MWPAVPVLTVPSADWHVAELATGVAVAGATNGPLWWTEIPPEVRAVLALFVLQVLRALAARVGLKVNGNGTKGTPDA